jgi:hypothetical protein
MDLREVRWEIGPIEEIVVPWSERDGVGGFVASKKSLLRR